MRIVCQQTIINKYHALFVIIEKSGKIFNCRLLQIIGGALETHRTNLHFVQYKRMRICSNHSAWDYKTDPNIAIISIDAATGIEIDLLRTSFCETRSSQCIQSIIIQRAIFKCAI